MRQILQHLRTGEIEIADVPCPQPRRGWLVIQSRASLISAGTERKLVEFSKAGLIAKARQQPEKVAQVLDKIKTDGLMPTLEAVFSKLGEPMPLGYCNAGVVLATGPDVTEFAPGDRVVSNGCHAEIVTVPKNLCAKIPEDVPDEQAAFTVLASIGLQGIRLLEPTLGERFAVFGLGLIGLMSVQLLRAAGCEVLGVDLNPERVELARRLGAEAVPPGGDPVTAASAWTGGKGVDGVLVAAAAKTDAIMHQSAEMCRKRGRLVLVGVVGLDLKRSDFYEKELTFQVSCSYGPGRYDSLYEQAGQDYPYPYVRWTEQRNFEAILQQMDRGSLTVEPLISHRFALDQAEEAYAAVTGDPSTLGVVLRYADQPERSSRVALASRPAPAAGQAVLGVIGAGNFAKLVMLPALARTDARVETVADLDPANARAGARRAGASDATTDYTEILRNDRIDAVLIAVGHSAHARLVIEALQAGKHAFVEKPLAMNRQELDELQAVAKAHPDRLVMVGFNRRFSPHTVRARTLLAGRSEPLCMTMTVNAGAIPAGHWVHDPKLGGGRVIGEGCHFIDLMVCLAGSGVRRVSAAQVEGGVAVADDKMGILLEFEDGSIGTINYFANGSKKHPKEMLTVFSEGRVLTFENFRRLVGAGFDGFSKFKTSRQDKGHNAEFAAFVDRVASGGEPLIPFQEMRNVTLASFAAVESARTHRPVDVD